MPSYIMYENVHEKIQGVFMENDSYAVSRALNSPLQTFIPKNLFFCAILLCTCTIISV